MQVPRARCHGARCGCRGARCKVRVPGAGPCRVPLPLPGIQPRHRDRHDVFTVAIAPDFLLEFDHTVKSRRFLQVPRARCQGAGCGCKVRGAKCACQPGTRTRHQHPAPGTRHPHPAPSTRHPAPALGTRSYRSAAGSQGPAMTTDARSGCRRRRAASCTSARVTAASRSGRRWS
jgi:hypothetical protein